MSDSRKKASGSRPKHVPQRMCIVCRRHDPKRALIRLVRTPEQRVLIDPTGKQAGRGAYLCHDPACWEQVLRRQVLERALHVEMLRPDDHAALEAMARSLAEPSTNE